MTASLPIIISVLALVVSLVSLWKNYLAPFKLKLSFDAPTFSLYEIPTRVSGGKHVWWIPSFDMGFTFQNTGSQAGEILDIRLVVILLNGQKEKKTYPFYARWIVDYPSFNKDGTDRMSWLDSSITREWYPLVLGGNAQTSVHVVIEGFRWDKKMSGSMDIKLEVYSSQASAWVEQAQYSMALTDDQFGSKSKYSPLDPKLAQLREGYDDWHGKKLPEAEITANAETWTGRPLS